MEKDAAVRAQGALTRLRTAVKRGEIRRAKREWGGANVLVCSIPRHTRHRELVTPHALEVSWMFESLRDAFSGLVDHARSLSSMAGCSSRQQMRFGAGPKSMRAVFVSHC